MLCYGKYLTTNDWQQLEGITNMVMTMRFFFFFFLIENGKPDRPIVAILPERDHSSTYPLGAAQ